ncbi:MAG: ATP-dependent zinc metalloprotease FtsH [Microgenomates group bacterium]|jgi:cell division protease FtsH|nr:ATP-dependent zinc metalloprotease FtsH [Candidatus Woesebacteria bacterium]MBP6883474.1 ATP-dependent zinc metalloprotease FtsH [Candidatus Woesebacteria bacterium]
MPSKKNPEKKVREFRLNINIRTFFISFFILLFLYFSFQSLSGEINKALPEKSLTTVISEIKQKKVQKVEVIDNKVLIYYKNKNLAITYKETSDSFVSTLKDSGVNPNDLQIVVKDTQGSSSLMSFLSNFIPTILMVAFFIFLFRQAKGAQENVFSFGQSRAKKFNKDISKITFKDVAGVDEAKKELEEVVDFLRHPDKYKKVGARTPKGVILIGPPGCGKTLLAKAVAGEAGVPFFSIAGSEFMEMLVGIGAARVRDLFATAKKSAPAIIFIDEIEAIGRARATGVMPSHDEREQTLNQILVEMDGFNPNEQVVVIAATNRGDLLDSALLRAGRFDRRILVDYPDLEGRKMILAIHSKNKPVESAVDWAKIAKRTVGFSGADIESMLNEAAIDVARQSKESITMNALEEAATKVKLGPEKKRLQSDYDKKLTAYHEAGHALVSHYQTHTDPVHRISIVSRGMALGYTLIPPEKDKLHETKNHLLQRIAVMMGGRAAEDLIFKEVTTGAANDFDQATSVAKAMVMEYGMSTLGPINLGPSYDVTEMGKATWQENPLSQETMSLIDKEVKAILAEGYKKATEIIKVHKKELDKVAKELLAKESLDQDEFEQLVGKKKQNIVNS